MKLLISGICGFAGSTLAKAWLTDEPSLTIYGIDNLSRPGSEQNRLTLQRLGIKLFHGDLRLASDLEGLPAVDWVLDAAANPSVLAGIDGHVSSRQLIEHNLLGTVNLLEYCKRQRAGLILLSSSRVYSTRLLGALPMRKDGERFALDREQPLPDGAGDRGIGENFSTTPPLSLYGSSKLASEVLALEYAEAFDFPVWINRCGILAGGGQFGRPDQGIMAFWINAWLRRRPLTYLGYNGHGLQVRDCLHPQDLLPLLRQQISAGPAKTERIFNLGGGTANSFSLKELSCRCRARFGAHTVESDPTERPYDIPWLIMDSSRAQQTWNWQPRTTLDEIFDQICRHAESNPDWLQISGLA